MLKLPSRDILFKFLLIVVVNIVFITGVLLVDYYDVAGGRYFLFIAIPIGLLNYVYSFYFALKKEHRHLKSDAIYRPEIFKPYLWNQIKILFVQIFVLGVILLIPLWAFLGNSIVLDEDAEIQKIVDSLIDDSMNETQKVDALLSWFNKNDNAPENFSSMYHRSEDKQILFHFLGMFYIYDESPHFCFRGSETPHWAIISRCGMCGEQAALLAEMGRIAGLNISHVHCIPEDHAWNEVYIEGREAPLIIDATTVKLPDSTGYKSVEFMQQKIARNWVDYGESPKEGNISFVYSKFPNDSKKYNVTHRYTDVINITVNVTNSNDKPVSNVMVKVISYNRPGVARRSCWGLEKITNGNGQCTFTLGGGRYKFELQHKDDWFPIKTDIKYFWEDENQQYLPVTYSSKTIIDVLIENPIYIILVVLLCLLVISIYFEKKRPPKLKS